MGDPSWSAALRRSVRDPVRVITVAVATGLLVLAAATNVLVVASGGQAAIEQLVAAADEQQLATAAADLVASVPPDAPEIAAAVDERLDAIDGFDPSVRQVTSIEWLVRSGAEAVRPVVRANGRIATAVMFHREDAVASLELVAGPDSDGEVWLPAALADRLDLVPGDPVEVGLEPIGAAATQTGAATVLAGTYAMAGERPTGVLADEGLRLPPAPGNLSEPAPLVLAEAEVITRLGREIGDIQVNTIQAPVTRPPRYEDLVAGVTQLEVLQRDLVDAESRLGSLVFEQFSGPVVRISSGIRRLTTQAVDTAGGVRAQTAATSTAGVLLAVATLAAVSLAVARREAEQTRLELVQGSAPMGIALRGLLTVVPGVLLGAVAGRLGVLPVAGLVLPGDRVPAPAVAALTPRTIIAAVTVAVVVIAVRGLDAWVRQTALSGREPTRSVPLVPMLVVAATVVAVGVVVGPPRPPTDPLVMVLPVVVIAAVAVLVLRTLVSLVPPGRTTDASSWWLARRRLAGQPARLVAVGALVATAVGLVAQTSVLHTSGRVAIDAKAASVAGASVVVGVPVPTVVEAPGVPDEVTVVLEDRGVRVLPEEEPATFLAVDPESFAAVATWPAGTTPDVLDALTASDGAALPVLLVESSAELGDRGTLERSDRWTLPYEVVGRPGALPGADPGRPLLLTSQAALFARLGDELDPREGPLDPDSSDLDGPWTTQVWLDVPVESAVLALSSDPAIGRSGVTLERTLAQVRAQPAYLAASWSLGVLGGLGVVVLALALLLLGGTRSRADDVAGLELVMLERLGVSGTRQRVAAVVERTLLVVVAGIVGIVVGIVLAALVLGAADPAPEVPPTVAVVVPMDLLVGVGVALLLGAVGAGLLDHRAARRADVEEALRVAR